MEADRLRTESFISPPVPCYDGDSTDLCEPTSASRYTSLILKCLYILYTNDVHRQQQGRQQRFWLLMKTDRRIRNVILHLNRYFG